MSVLAESIFLLLRELFPFTKIVKEYFITYKGQRLFVDFYLPSFLIAIEVHGKQHDEFVLHYHGSADGWRRHKKRDRLKEEWASVNGIKYVVIREKGAPKTKDDLLRLIERLSYD